MARRRLKKGARKAILILFLIVIIGVGIILGSEVIEYEFLKKVERTPIANYDGSYFLDRDFGMMPSKITNDYNDNGMDDKIDILNGAKKFADNNPKFVSKYYAGGYPPDKEGVSSDVIWYSLKEAGFYLKDMLNQDIIDTKKDKIYNISIPDENIDFRRIGNIEIFLGRYVEELTTNINNFKEFQPGDIIFFDYGDHVAIVSDKRNIRGIPYIIHNRGGNQKEKEENFLESTNMILTSHYRFVYNEKIQELMEKAGES